MTARIREFLKRRKDEGPCLVVDLDVVRENYLAFAKSLPDSKVFYAVKANPAPEILKLLAALGCCFDVASVNETQAALEAGASPERISYGNTIKKESDIAAAFALGVTLYAVDCEAEVEKVARAAPGSRVICRIHCDGTGSEWPLSRKFGCEPEFATDILELAHKHGLVAHGISFHVGSQSRPGTERWPRRRRSSAAAPSAASTSPWSISAAASRPAMCARPRSLNPTARRSSARCAGILAMPFRKPSWSLAAASSAMPA
jgi:ornithine decarboxylase